MFVFDADKTKKDLIQWINDWFEENGHGCRAVIGISGGIDSSVVTALCVEALGKERVIAVQMPCGTQADIEDSELLIHHLGITSLQCNIQDAVNGVMNQLMEELPSKGFSVTTQTKINLPARIRMSTLYAVAQSVDGRVMNTSNKSESWVGWDTRYGDSVGDCSPLGNLTKTEIRQIAASLGLPDRLVHKTPIDGLCGKTDEESFGFSYDVLDHYIRTGEIDDPEIKKKIDRIHQKNLFKLALMPSFPFDYAHK